MISTILLTLVGLIIGAASLGSNGWLAGAVIGFLTARVMDLGAQLKALSSKISHLELQLQLQLQVGQLPPSTRPPLSEAVPAAASEPEPVPLVATAGNMPANPPVDPVVPRPPVSAEALFTPEDLSASEPIASPESTGAINTVDKPGPADKLISLLVGFFSQGNPLVRVGMVVLFFGLTFLVKYAAGEGLIPPEMRLAAVALIAVVLVILGWKTRFREGGYGLVLQGGGVAALYLTVFAALKLFQLMSPGFALIMMILLVLLGTALAVLQNAQVLALIATAGGFLSPILTSDGSGSHITLFSFYLLLNAGILTIAWFKTWRTLNWIGFVFTFVIASLWGVLRYEPVHYASTQPFLIAFFAFYLVVTLLFSLKQPPKLTGLVDGSLVFGLPIVAFGLQSALLRHTEFGLAISALILAGIYAALAVFLWKKFQHSLGMLIESFIALGVTFATLAIPLALDAQWTSVTWALEAVGLIWVGLRQQRLRPRCAGYLLYLGAAVSLLLQGGLTAGPVPLLSGDFISLIILAATALMTGYLLSRFASVLTVNEALMGFIALIIGWCWWLLAGIHELESHLDKDTAVFFSGIFFFTLSSWGAVWLSRQWRWPLLNHLGFWLLPLVLLWTWIYFLLERALHPFQDIAGLTLIVFVAAQYHGLWQRRDDPRQWLVRTHHVISAWFVLLLIFWEASWWQSHYQWQGTSAILLWFCCLALPLVALLSLLSRNHWPFASYAEDYRNSIPAPLLLLMLIWFLQAATESGRTAFAYVPFFNPLDLSQLAAILLLGYAINRNLLNMGALPTKMRWILLGSAFFIWLNLLVLRSVHHYGDVAYTEAALWHSELAQTAMSILWALCSLGLMVAAHRHRQRQAWQIGAGLLGLVVFKLFTLDLRGSSTLAGIISFMVVGALILLIGYLAPMPAKPQEYAEKENR